MRFLIVDDDADYRQLLRYHLEVEWPDAVIDEYQPSSAGPLPASLALAGVDLVLLGHPTAADDGLKFLEGLCKRADCPPVLLFAAESDEFLAVDALKAGAANFFPKDRVKHQRLIAAVSAELKVDRVDPAGMLLANHRVLNGTRKRRVVAKLYASDLSSVYLAESEDGTERLALKVLRHVPDAGGGRLFDRFLQEYEVIARVDHPNVVRIFDLGVADDHAYLAMEYLGAGSLAERLVRPLEPATALGYVRQIGGALQAIHGAGVLHRDLKPGNIMFRDDGSLALIDFGLAKQMRLHAAITGTGQIFGTPYYMSPEQGHAEPTDERSDLYSVGCILYEMLTGDRPFTASSPMGVIYRHAHAPRPRLVRGTYAFSAGARSVAGRRASRAFSVRGRAARGARRRQGGGVAAEGVSAAPRSSQRTKLACSYHAPSTMRCAGRPSSVKRWIAGRCVWPCSSSRTSNSRIVRSTVALIHVHDVFGLGRDLGGAHLTQVGRDLAALGQRLREEVALPGRGCATGRAMPDSACRRCTADRRASVAPAHR